MKIIETTDYEAIARLNQSVQTLHSSLYPEYFKEYNYEDIEEFFKGLINKPDFIFLLLEDHDQLIGYGWIELKNYKENAFMKAYKSIYVHQICILAAERRKGYGLKLMESIYGIAKANQIGKIELDYWSENTIAKDFYQKNGFLKYREFVYKEI
jgi:diamine N-acetyltransferase